MGCGRAPVSVVRVEKRSGEGGFHESTIEVLFQVRVTWVPKGGAGSAKLMFCFSGTTIAWCRIVDSGTFLSQLGEPGKNLPVAVPAVDPRLGWAPGPGAFTGSAGEVRVESQGQIPFAIPRLSGSSAVVARWRAAFDCTGFSVVFDLGTACARNRLGGFCGDPWLLGGAQDPDLHQ